MVGDTILTLPKSGDTNQYPQGYPRFSGSWTMLLSGITLHITNYMLLSGSLLLHLTALYHSVAYLFHNFMHGAATAFSNTQTPLQIIFEMF